MCDPGWADLVVPDDIWALISPTAVRSAGLLCPNCMIFRCADIGLENVSAKFTSGPFAEGGDAK